MRKAQDLFNSKQTKVAFIVRVQTVSTLRFCHHFLWCIEHAWDASGHWQQQPMTHFLSFQTMFWNNAFTLFPRAHLLVVGMSWFTSDTNQQSLPTPFYFVLASISVFMAHSTVFHSINSPNNSPLSDSILPVLPLPYWSFQLYISLWKSPSALIIILSGWLGSQHQLTN